MELAEDLVAYGKKKGAAEIEVGDPGGDRVQRPTSARATSTTSPRRARGRYGCACSSMARWPTAGSSDLSKAHLEPARGQRHRPGQARRQGRVRGASRPREGGSRDRAPSSCVDPAILELTPESRDRPTRRRPRPIGLAQGAGVKMSLGARFVTVDAVPAPWSNSRASAASTGAPVAYAARRVPGRRGGQPLPGDYWFEGGTTSLAKLPEPERARQDGGQARDPARGRAEGRDPGSGSCFEPPVAVSLLLGLLAASPAVPSPRTVLSWSRQLATRSPATGWTMLTTPPRRRLGTAPVRHDLARKVPVVEAGVPEGFCASTPLGGELGVPSTGDAGPPTLFWRRIGPGTDHGIVEKGCFVTGTSVSHRPDHRRHLDRSLRL